MHNTFYSAFDTEHFGGTRRQDPTDHRTAFEQDRDRIIYTAAFRRLQNKTQVFLSGEYDFYRTRLTHSLEVSQIGRAICSYLRHVSPKLGEAFYIDPDLVDAVCLSHDIGHPPYGHSGERVMNQLMRPYGGFEGNAQTLRMLTETIFNSDGARFGMKPTRALMDGVMKYKAVYSAFENPKNHFIYDDQQACVDFIFDGAALPADLADPKKLNKFKSIECQVMDWADETAYSLNDLMDSIQAGFITTGRLEEWGNGRDLTKAEAGHLEALIKAVRDDRVTRTLAGKVGTFIRATELRERENFMSERTNRYRFELVVDPEIEAEQRLYSKIAVDLVFRSARVHQIEHKSRVMLERTFGVLRDNYIEECEPLHLLPPKHERGILGADDAKVRARLICDYVAGMTDGFATRTYKRLFDPDFGSIGDLV